jgi:hypothetical protein
VTSKKDQEQYWADKRMPYQYVSVVTMTEAFKEFEVGRELSAHLSTPLDKTSSHPAALVHKKFALSKWELFKACTAREILLIKRNRFLYIFRTCQVSGFKIQATVLPLVIMPLMGFCSKDQNLIIENLCVSW